MQDVGYAALQIIPSFKGFDSALESGTSKGMLVAGQRGGTRFGDAAGRSAGSRFGSVFSTAAKASLLGVFGAGALAVKLGKDAIGLASDQAESVNAVNVTYEKQARAVQKLGKQAADSLGLSRAEFNGLSVQFSAFATQIAGGAGPKVVGVLDELTTRGADFASVMNLDVNEAMALFQSGLAGETEPLRKYGIDLSAAAVEHHALATGIADSKGELTESEKVQARYSLLMKQTSKTQGDFANTSDSLANRQRILNARWDDARAKLGTALLPIMEDVAGFLLDKGIPAFEKASDWVVDKGVPAFQDFADEMKPLANEILPAAGDALGIVRDFAQDAVPYAKDLVGAFNDMPDWMKTVLVGGGTGILAGKKLGLGSLFGGGGGLLSKATPLPVFVTNPGFGTGTPGVPNGKPKLPIAAVGGTATAAAALAGLGTWGVHSASQSLAPTQTAKGNWGSPGAQQGITMEGLDFTPSESTSAAWSNYFGTLQGTYRGFLSEMARDFKNADLPSELKTHIALTGAPESKAAARDLVAQYDLTPKEKRTLFQLIGIDKAQGDLRGTKSMLDQIRDKTVTVTVHTVRTGDNGDGVGYASGGQRPRTSTSSADREDPLPRASTVILQVGERQFDAYVDERADARVSTHSQRQRTARGQGRVGGP